MRHFSNGCFPAIWVTAKSSQVDMNKQRWSYFRGAAKLGQTHFDRLFPSLFSVLVGLGGGGKVKWVGWKGAAEKKELPPYLESKFFTKVGEQILISICCFAVQPHNMVWTPSDPAPNQLQNSTQTLSLAGYFIKRHLTILRISLTQWNKPFREKNKYHVISFLCGIQWKK